MGVRNYANLLLERKLKTKMMKIIYRIIVFSFLTIIINSCDTQISKRDLEGTWESNDGALIVLNEDGTYTVKGINYFLISGDKNFNGQKIDLTGKWHIGKTGNQEKKTVELISNLTYKDFGIHDTYVDKNGLEQSHKINCSFEVSESGLFSNKPPYSLFVHIGDPDDMNKYNFTKK